MGKYFYLSQYSKVKEYDKKRQIQEEVNNRIIYVLKRA